MLEASTPIVSGTAATFTLTAFAGAQTASATASDAAGSVNIPVSLTLCGRPEGLALPTLVNPVPNAVGVPTTIGKLYFAVWTTSQSASMPMLGWTLRLVSTQPPIDVTGMTVVASPPPNSGQPFPPPPSGIGFTPTLAYVTANIPTLTPGTSYTTQIVDDTCQGVNKAGTFST